MDYFYTDYGNHEAWTSALQGGSFCRVNRMYRFFEGTDDVRPCLGSDFFRLDSQISVNNSASLGTIVDDYSEQTPASTAMSPVGIVEDENSEHGRYFYLDYLADGNGNMQVQSLKVADSSYTDELSVLSGVDSWVPPVTVEAGAELGMRVVNMGRDLPAPNRTYVYYLETTATTSNIYFLGLPDSGDPASVAVPLKVAEIDVVTRDRFYVVYVRDNLVALYLGDSDRSQDRRTSLIVHDPTTNSVLFGPTVVSSGSIPFPQSYAACVGKGDEIHMMLEPPASWRNGWATLNSDRPGSGGEAAAPRQKSSGNAWTLTTFIEDGTILEDQILFNGTDIQPWLGASSADSFGDRYRASVIPWFMGRQSAPPAKFAETFGNTPDFDTSCSYFLSASVGTRQPGTDEESNFLQRVDRIDDLRNTYGSHRSASNWENEISQPNEPSDDRRKHNFLVPGTVMIEPLEPAPVGLNIAMSTLGTQAVRIDNWRLEDDDSSTGEPGPGFLAPVPLNAHNPRHNPSTDCTHGVQAGFFDEGLAFVVGWFTNGDVSS